MTVEVTEEALKYHAGFTRWIDESVRRSATQTALRNDGKGLLITKAIMVEAIERVLRLAASEILEVNPWQA